MYLGFTFRPCEYIVRDVARYEWHGCSCMYGIHLAGTRLCMLCARAHTHTDRFTHARMQAHARTHERMHTYARVWTIQIHACKHRRATVFLFVWNRVLHKHTHPCHSQFFETATFRYPSNSTPHTETYFGIRREKIHILHDDASVAAWIRGSVFF